MTLQWALLDEPFTEPPEWAPRQCHTPKCQLCGRFTKSLHLVWTSFPPGPDYEVGECCRQPEMRLQP